MTDRKRKVTKTERLMCELNELLDEYGLVDISVGQEKYYCVSRGMLLQAAHRICEDPYRYIHRFKKGKTWITVLSCFGRQATLAGLEARFRMPCCVIGSYVVAY